MSYEEDVKQEFLDKNMYPPKDEYLEGFPSGLGLKRRVPFRDFWAWLESCPVPYYLKEMVDEEEETYAFDTRNLMDKYDEDRNWELFDEEFYALLKKHTGVEFNEEPKDFDLYCSIRDKIWEELQKKEIV